MSRTDIPGLGSAWNNSGKTARHWTLCGDDPIRTRPRTLGERKPKLSFGDENHSSAVTALLEPSAIRPRNNENGRDPRYVRRSNWSKSITSFDDAWRIYSLEKKVVL